MKTNTIESEEMDRLFKEATLEAAEILGQQYMEEAAKDPYLPPFEFNQRINKLIEKETKSTNSKPFFQQLYLSFSKVSMWVLIVLVVLFISVPTVASARNWVTKLVMESNPSYVTYYLQENEEIIKGNDAIESLLPIGTYYPSYLPGDMRLSQLVYDGSTTTYRYRDSKNKFVLIQVIGSDTTMNLDNENLEVDSQELVNGIQARYTLKLERHTLIWKVEKYLLLVSTNLSKEEALKLATGLMVIK